MLDFRPKRPSKNPRFTLDRAEMIRQAGHQHRSKRGIWHGLFLTVMAGAIVWLMVDWLRISTPPVVRSVGNEIEAPMMPRPLLEGRPALPSRDAVTAVANDITDELNKGIPPAWTDDSDPVLLAWAQAITARDANHPPLPQAVETRDLVLRRVRPGSVVLISGQVQDSVSAVWSGSDADAPDALQRMIIMLAPDQYAYVIAPKAARTLAVGSNVLAMGRYAGAIRLSAQPGADKKALTVEVPLIIARRVNPDGSLDDGDRPFWREEGAFTVPADAYHDIDDERLMLETRPYYYLLGQVSRERSTPNVFADAANANQVADDLHQQPNDHRSAPYRVRGTVFHAWVDEQVARDRPFGVQRVVRIITWSEDYSPVTVGFPPHKETKRVLRAFEFAAISDQPLPEPGTVITVTGRFLRMRAMEVKPNAARAAQSGYERQSDRSYSFFFVTDAWTVIPPEPPPRWEWWNTVILIVVLILTGLLFWRIRSAQQREGYVQEAVRKLRSVRWKQPKS